MSYSKTEAGVSLAVQWLSLRAANAKGAGWIPGQGTKILHAVEQPSAYTVTSKSKPCTRKKDPVHSNQCSQIKREGRKEPQFWDPLIVYIIQMSYLIDKVSSSNNRK